MQEPYIIKSLTLLTYDGRRIPIEVVKSEIIKEPLHKVKNRLYDKFKDFKMMNGDIVTGVDVRIRRI